MGKVGDQLTLAEGLPLQSNLGQYQVTIKVVDD